MERLLLWSGGVVAAVDRDRQEAPPMKANDIEIDYDFQGGVTLATSGVKNGLLAAIELGLVDKPDATEILLLIREATDRLMRDIVE